MAAPASLLQGARAFARDFPRDQMPRGYLWDVVDYVPLIVDAGLTGRGGWTWASDVLADDPVAGIVAQFDTGDKLLTVNANKTWSEIDMTTGAVTPRSAAYTARQNPIQYYDTKGAGPTVILPDGDGVGVPQLIKAPGGVFTPDNMASNMPKAPLATVYKGFVVLGGTPTEKDIVRFVNPNFALNSPSAYDANANLPSSMAITALGALRSVLLIFHAGSVERARGSIPPATGQTNNDMFVEGLFDRVGCSDPKTIAYWNDNCIFADEHGVHITDGAVIRNLASQGSILYYWRTIWGGKVTAAATTFLDYYQITIRRTTGPPITLVCDLNRRQWFRFANIYALSYFGSSGSGGMERMWGGMAGTKRLARLSPMYFPTLLGAPIADADGVSVLPTLETPWYRLGPEGRKRARFVYVSYDARTGATPNVLDVGVIGSPSAAVYRDIGGLPPTSDYSRYRLPISDAPYGVGFKLTQLVPSNVTRMYDIAVDGQPEERSAL